jgi:hypothetical protein
MAINIWLEPLLCIKLSLGQQYHQDHSPVFLQTYRMKLQRRV